MNNDQKLRRILILDDNSDYRKLLLRHLGNMFKDAVIVEYDPVTRGAPGDDFDWSDYDVLILDYQLNLPGVTGLDIFQKNKKQEAFPATIMLTGAGTEQLALKVLDYGIYNYLDKQKLSKETLQSSIIDAFNKNRTARAKILEQTNHSQGFNKALFYQKLEYQLQLGDDAIKRILLLIQLDLHEHLEEQFGILIRDNIIRHIAKKTFELFIKKNYHPSVTRLGEATIALITDSPGDGIVLDNLLQELCTELESNQYKYKGKEFNHKISIGAVRLPTEQIPAEVLIKKAMGAVATAAQVEDNSFHVAPQPGEEGAAPERAEQPPRVPTPVPAKTHSADELILEDTDLDVAGLKIKQAIDQKRIIQTFRPVISLFSDDSGAENYYLSTQLIDKNGDVLPAEEIYNNIKTPKLQQYFDRWMLREALGRIINSEDKSNYFFIMKLSEASLADTTLFNWLRKLLTGIEGKHPGKSIALEISAHDFFSLQKQSKALMSYLHKSHGFRFVLSAVTGIQEITGLPKDANFEFIRTDKALIKIMNETLPPGAKQGTLINVLKARGIRIITDGIEDSTSLTNAIVIGADYALGGFIGAETAQLDENKFVESFEIT
jgi:EAL domain-containing protein (putative c-di-GMP-specific phosphodiesterase class I)/DNA-binding response OmpR family regulator